MIYMNKFYVFILLLIFVLSGCAVKSSNFSVIKPVSGKGAVVYIYRPNSMSNILISPDVLVDGDKKFKIKSSEYMAVYLPAGKHRFSLDLSGRYEGKHLIDLTLADAEIYFLRIDATMKFQMNEQYKRRFDILNVSNDIALTEISACRNSVKKKTTNTKVVQTAIEASPDLDSMETGTEGVSILADDPASMFSISKTKNPFSKSR